MNGELIRIWKLAFVAYFTVLLQYCNVFVWRSVTPHTFSNVGANMDHLSFEVLTAVKGSMVGLVGCNTIWSCRVTNISKKCLKMETICLSERWSQPGMSLWSNVDHGSTCGQQFLEAFVCN
jgi:hypothetical protein